MLRISRKKNQTVRIGPDIVIKVTGMRGGYVGLGITAPKELEIVRDDARVQVKKPRAA